MVLPRKVIRKGHVYDLWNKQVAEDGRGQATPLGPKHNQAHSWMVHTYPGDKLRLPHLALWARKLAQDTFPLLPWLELCPEIIKHWQTNSRKERTYLSLEVIVHTERSQGKNQRRDQDCLLDCSACFVIQLRTTCLGVALPTVGWALPFQSLIKKMPHRLGHEPIQ